MGRNNPSYHALAHFRAFRDYIGGASAFGTTADEGEQY